MWESKCIITGNVSIFNKKGLSSYLHFVQRVCVYQTCIAMQCLAATNQPFEISKAPLTFCRPGRKLKGNACPGIEDPLCYHEPNDPRSTMCTWNQTNSKQSSQRGRPCLKWINEIVNCRQSDLVTIYLWDEIYTV